MRNERTFIIQKDQVLMPIIAKTQKIYATNNYYLSYYGVC
jgi:hypothetical protein